MNRDVTVGDQKKTLQNKKHLKILAGFMVFIIALYVVLFLFFRDAPTEVELTLEQRVESNEKRISSLETAKESQPPVVEERQVHKTLRVNTQHSNVRSGPSTDFKIVDTLNVGDSVTVGEIIDNWYPLTKGGFIHKSLVN